MTSPLTNALGHTSAYIPLRDVQAQYAQRVCVHLDELTRTGETARILPLQAATGVGKTLGYLLPIALDAALTGERAIVATHTLALMRQIEMSDLPRALDAVERATGKRLVVARKLGRRNFYSVSRLEAERDNANDDATREAVDDLLEWLLQNDSSGLIEDAGENYGLSLPESIGADRVCVLPRERSEHVARHGEQARLADITLTTQATLVADATFFGGVVTKGERPAKIIVVDEADALVDTAASFANIRLDTTEFAAMGLHGGEDIQEALAAGEVTPELLAAVGASIARGVEHAESRSWLDDLTAWRRAATDDDPKVVAAVDGTSLRLIRLDPARVLSRLWRAQDGEPPLLRSVILTSATLTLSEDAGAFLRSIGADPLWNSTAPLATFAPQRFGSLRFTLADRRVPFHFNEGTLNKEWLAYAATMIEAARRAGGRVLVLSPSYKEAADLGACIPGAIVHHRGQPLASHLEAYRAHETACLITPAAWTGVDLPGFIDHLVITRVPIAPPDEAAARAYEDWFEDKGGSKSDARGILDGRAFSAASRKLAQGIGRAVRQAEDRVHVWIADPRMPVSPAVVARKFGMTQGRGDVRFIPAIPKRFRLGPGNALDKAEIFSTEPVQATA